MDAKANDWVSEGLDYSEPDSVEMNRLLFRMMCGVNAQAFRAMGHHVISGPFAGMAIPSTGPWDDGNSGVKLLGDYEFELHDAIGYAAWRRPSVVVNVGCAEGYYAVGLARMIPRVTVYAFDTNADSRNMCARFASENGVADRVNLAEGCQSPVELSLPGVPKGHRLYVMDVEGAELTLIDPVACPELRRSDIIVECHDFLDKDASYMVAERLNPTHRVELVRPRLPDLNKFQFLRDSPSVMSALMVVEKRPMPCCWLACWAVQRE